MNASDERKPKMMRFVVVGLGMFGTNLAISLAKKKHEVVAMDVDPRKVQHVRDFVSHAVVADVKDFDALEEFVDGGVTAVVVDLGATDASIFTVVRLRQLRAKNIIAKAKDELHGDTLKTVGAHVIVYPEKDVAQQLAEKLHNPNMIEYLPLTPEFSIIEMPSPPGVIGKTMREMGIRQQFGVHIVAIRNVSLNAIELIPDPNARVSLGSSLVVLGRTEDIEAFKRYYQREKES